MEGNNPLPVEKTDSHPTPFSSLNHLIRAAEHPYRKKPTVTANTNNNQPFTATEHPGQTRNLNQRRRPTLPSWLHHLQIPSPAQLLSLQPTSAWNRFAPPIHNRSTNPTVLIAVNDSQASTNGAIASQATSSSPLKTTD